MEDLISVIMPVYNAEKYLKESIDSILNQTYSNIELLIIDDGSTDTSGSICDELLSKDNRVVVYHIDNGGQGKARNYGVNQSHGKYIAYVDSDDIFDEDYIETLYEGILRTNSDIACCSFVKFTDTIPKINIGQDVQYITLSPKAAIENLCYQRFMNNSPCCKLLKRDLAQDISFPLNKGYEDYAVVYKWLIAASSICYIDKPLYFYRQVKGGTMRSAWNSKKMDRVYISQELSDTVSSLYPELKVAADVRFFMGNIQTLMWVPISRKYNNEYRIIGDNIKQVRRSVLCNKKAKKTTRIMALSSYLGIYILRLLGGIYRRLFAS